MQKVLVKWTGLPYAEATFELLDEVMANIDGGRAGVLEYKVRTPGMCAWHVHLPVSRYGSRLLPEPVRSP